MTLASGGFTADTRWCDSVSRKRLGSSVPWAVPFIGTNRRLDTLSRITGEDTTRRRRSTEMVRATPCAVERACDSRPVIMIRMAWLQCELHSFLLEWQ